MKTDGASIFVRCGWRLSVANMDQTCWRTRGSAASPRVFIYRLGFTGWKWFNKAPGWLTSRFCGLAERHSQTVSRQQAGTGVALPNPAACGKA